MSDFWSFGEKVASRALYRGLVSIDSDYIHSSLLRYMYVYVYSVIRL